MRGEKVSRRPLVALVLATAIAAAACSRGGAAPVAAPTPAGEPPVTPATPPPGQVRVFLNTRPGMAVDQRVLQELADAYSFLWPALFNAMANGDEAMLQGVAAPEARAVLMGRAHELAAQGQRLLVTRMRQRPLVVEAGAERVVVEDEAEVEAELLAEGQKPGQGKATQERWAFRTVWARLPEGWRLTEAEVRWQG